VAAAAQAVIVVLQTYLLHRADHLLSRLEQAELAAYLLALHLLQVLTQLDLVIHLQVAVRAATA
jgi:hypothetical protein